MIDNGADWFLSYGTRESSGTKLLSISGDCKRPGVYEVEWGVTVEALLKRAGATNVQAVQIGGPSGTCIAPPQFGRQIAFEDLATGGAMIIIGEKRDLLRDFILNYMNFFIEESCSSCSPCRALTVILRNKLLKILDGHGTKQDIDELYTWAWLRSSCKSLRTGANCRQSDNYLDREFPRSLRKPGLNRRDLCVNLQFGTGRSGILRGGRASAQSPFSKFIEKRKL